MRSSDPDERGSSLYARGFGQHGVRVGRLAGVAPRVDGADAADAVADARCAVTETTILLPVAALSADHRLLAHATIAHAIGHLRFSQAARDAGGHVPMMIAVLSMLEDVRVERLMARRYPGLRLLWGRFHRPAHELQAMGLSFATLMQRLSLALHDPAYRDPHHWVQKGQALLEAIGGDLHDAARFGEVGAVLANDLGQMRVRFDAASYRVEPAYRDDNTYLWRFENSEPQAAIVQPDDTVTQSADAGGTDTATPDRQTEIAHAPVTYPEWDYKTNVLRSDWVGIVEGVPVRTARQHEVDLWPLASRPEVPACCYRVRSIHRLRRQPDGDDLDLDAVIEHEVMRRAGQSGDGRVFTNPAPRARETSVLILLDLSESTARAATDSGSTLLDLERQAAESAIAAFDSEHVRVAVHGFSSNGRSEVRYVRFKDFGSHFSAGHRAALAAVRPAWSTRLGAALRHAGACIEQESHRLKSVIVMTDGQPSDIDVFDLRYLIEDARHAVRTLAHRRVRTHCIVVGLHERRVATEIFGS
ncbi:nitric oxide reductase activation protein NorD [Paraburkholderia sp. SOS3]|uniref:nitric oxide reductase activation protein NorD n=1 Tax=Paraburkholderia sp. SOS3 TaxID=1926494 RepID=UPI0009478047|nr:VWA domain-containing protein [Paraburkholderia sp. SOS3]APR34997.1 hypothetical protein BTO02_05660 [Paraburkholderia sp. SOS3]